MTFKRLLPVLAIVAALGVAACGDDDTEKASTDTASTPAATETAAATEASTEELTADGIPDYGDDLKSEPQITVPEAAPPTKLLSKDVIVGDGKTAKPGDTVSMQYTGTGYTTGQKFDASWDRGGEPFTFQLGGGQVIPGWDEGIAGMKEGGRRVLVLPPDLAYGPNGAPPAIGPNETLIFVVDLEKVK